MRMLRPLNSILRSLKWSLRSVPRFIKPRSHAPCRDLQPPPFRVLTLGVCLTRQRNSFAHARAELGRSRCHEVIQRWVVIDPSYTPSERRSEHVYERLQNEKAPRPKLINSLLQGQDLASFDYIVLVDDDITLPRGFIDDYIAMHCRLGFALSQPARTFNSYINFPITKRVPGLLGRQTHFVEGGPVVCISKELFKDLLPLDEAAPNSYGADLTWPPIVQARGFTMGVIDCVPVDHSLRAAATTYELQPTITAMGRYLSTHAHVRESDMAVNIRSFAE
jgi:hypothetical protein